MLMEYSSRDQAVTSGSDAGQGSGQKRRRGASDAVKIEGHVGHANKKVNTGVGAGIDRKLVDGTISTPLASQPQSHTNVHASPKSTSPRSPLRSRYSTVSPQSALTRTAATTSREEEDNNYNSAHKHLLDWRDRVRGESSYGGDPNGEWYAHEAKRALEHAQTNTGQQDFVPLDIKDKGKVVVPESDSPDQWEPEKDEMGNPIVPDTTGEIEVDSNSDIIPPDWKGKNLAYRRAKDRVWTIRPIHSFVGEAAMAKKEANASKQAVKNIEDAGLAPIPSSGTDTDDPLRA